MKAVIVDLKGKYAAALDENGNVIRLRNANYSIGQTVQLQAVKHSRTPSVKRLGTVAAAAALILAIGTGTAYATPYGTVSLDADSSIEYTINRFDHVLKVKALNEEGEALLSNVEERTLCFRPVEQAIAATLENRDIDSNDTDSIQITAETRSKRHTERLQEHLTDRITVNEDHILPDDMPEPSGRPEPAESGYSNENQLGLSDEMPEPSKGRHSDEYQPGPDESADMPDQAQDEKHRDDLPPDRPDIQTGHENFAQPPEAGDAGMTDIPQRGLPGAPDQGKQAPPK